MIKKALKAAAKNQGTAIHLAASAMIVIIAALAVRNSVFTSASPIKVAAAFLAAWFTYSAAAARTTSNDFKSSFQKALILDGLTYLPMPLMLIAKIVAEALGTSQGYEAMGQLPVILAFGAALAANVAGKVMLFPKNGDAILNARLPARRATIAVLTAIAVYFLLFSAFSVMRHASLNSTAYDLAIFDQTLWGYSNGEMLTNTVRGVNLLADHAQPILFLIAPLYKLAPMPEGLLVLQALALTLGALPLYWMARRRIGAAAAAMISISYLLYPSLQYINLFDFHPEALAIPIILFAMNFIDLKKYLAGTAMLALAGTTKEQFPIAIAAIGAYVFLAHRKKLIGAAMALVGLAWLAINFKVILPHFAGQAAYAHFRGYEYLGSTLTEAVKNIVMHPQLAVARILRPDSLTYLTLLLFPAGAAAIALLGAPMLLLAAPFFAINLLRSHDLTTAILYQHNAELIPFIFTAAVLGSATLVKLLSRLKVNNARTATGLLILLTAITASAAYGPVTTVYDVKQMIPGEHAKIGEQLLSMVPWNASVSADPLLLPHLAHRKQAYMFPNPFTRFMYGEDYWTMQNGTEEAQAMVEYVILDLTRTSPSYNASLYAQFVKDFINNRNYGLERMEDGYSLFKKGSDYEKGLCNLAAYFAIARTGMRLELQEALSTENKGFLKQC